MSVDFDLNVDENGNLKITLGRGETIERLKEEMEEKTSLDILIEGTECFWTNGGYQPFDGGAGNPWVGMTDAPCIAEEMDHCDNGDRTVVGDCWYYPGYMVDDFLEDIIENGFTLFRKL